MKRKSRSYDYDRRDFEDYNEPESVAKRKPTPSKVASIISATSLAVLAGVFILGIGLGIGFYSVVSSGTTGNKIDNTIQLESKLPNPEVCVQFGSAAITMDARIYVTLNPLNVFVSQPITRPGCVLRTSNWSVLEQRGLLTSDQIRDCKNRLNTFGYTGSLDDKPQISCIYQNDAAQNLFLPGAGGATSDNVRFR
jgi:hypothetical protein